MSEINIPVLAVFTMPKCGACKVFMQNEVKVLKNKLKGKVRIVEFSKTVPFPSTVSKYGEWAPSFALLAPKSYYRVFTHDNKDNNEYSKDYSIKGLKYNAIRTSEESKSHYEYAGKKNTAIDIADWVERNSALVLSIDEPTPPRMYKDKF
jgi:hypothetical protein